MNWMDFMMRILLVGLWLLDGWMLMERHVLMCQIEYSTSGLIWLILAAVILALLHQMRKLDHWIYEREEEKDAVYLCFFGSRFHYCGYFVRVG